MDFEETAFIGDLVEPTITRNPKDSARITGHVRAYKTDTRGRRTLVARGENAITNAGRDWIFDQLYTNATAGSRGANYLAVSTSSTDSAAADTTFAGEVTGNGLARVDTTSTGTVSHTAGTNTATISNTYTATGSVAGIHKAALFHSSTSNQPIHFFNFASDTSLVSGERLTIEWTLTIT